MRKHTITLALICKNEVHNFPRLLKSVEGCFDEIHVTDTGSTDGTVEYLTDLAKTGMPCGAKVKLKHFEWVDDFAAARNHSFKDVTTDFVMWMDLDDVLSDRDAFNLWKEVEMPLADYWLATYHYAYEGGKPVISFLRERAIRVSKKPKWDYFIHEGCPPPEGSTMQICHSWQVCHQRGVQDLAQDKGRNLAIFERHIKAGEKLKPRMQFYYGKELFENGDHLNSWRVLKDAVKLEGLELGDRILALQYLANAALMLKTPQSLAEAIAYAHQGLQLDPTRSEFWCIMGDAYLVQMRFQEAKGFYTTAMTMPNKAPTNGRNADFIHHVDACHGIYPHKQMIKALFNLGQFEQAMREIDVCLKKYPHDPEIKGMKQDCQTAIDQVSRDESKMVETDEIVITTPPLSAYEWDDEVYSQKGVGGSETACVEMATWLKRLTGRTVIVFNMRKTAYTSPDGVQYLPNTEANTYFSKKKPELHIAWRHNIKMTSAPTYIWCHDLRTQGGENHQAYDGILALSEFHKRYLKSSQGIPSEKIILTRNGIETSRFKDVGQVTKKPNKVIFSSSPDRGLGRAIAIVEKAREKLPDLELHGFYGFDNMRKSGMGAMADHFEGLIKARPWVKYHGNVSQKVLAEHMMEAGVWLYPANFIESFCITAIESIAARCFPIVRDIGALPDTLSEAILKKQALLLDRDAETEEEVQFWADQLVQAIESKAWERITIDAAQYSWESVAREWIKLFGLEPRAAKSYAPLEFDHGSEAML